MLCLLSFCFVLSMWFFFFFIAYSLHFVAQFLIFCKKKSNPSFKKNSGTFPTSKVGINLPTYE